MIHRTLCLFVDCSICGSKEDHMSSLCFEIFLFIHKIVFKKKLLLFGKKESGIIRIEIGCLVKRPFHQKRKKSESLLDLMVVME